MYISNNDGFVKKVEFVGIFIKGHHRDDADHPRHPAGAREAAEALCVALTKTGPRERTMMIAAGAGLRRNLSLLK